MRQSGNLYVYCVNDPVFYIDLTGELAWPGEIHNKVVEYVGKKHNFYQEQRIGYRTGRAWGRADLISSTGEIWDVKPNKANHIIAGERQVLRYTEGIWLKRPSILTGIPLRVGEWIAPDAFIYQSEETTYYISYYYAGGGVIVYDYDTATDWVQVGERAMNLLVVAGITYLISATGGVAVPVLAPA